MEIYAWICAIVFVIGLFRGLSGFAAALIGLPLLVFLMDIKIAVPLVTLLGVFSTTILLFQLWNHLDWKEVYPLIMGFIPGILIGVFVLKTLDRSLLQVLLGIILVSFSIYSLFFKSFKLKPLKGGAYVFGFLGGCLRGSIGAGGPAIIIYTSMQPWNKDKIKVTMQGFFMVTVPMTIIVQAANGLITMTVLKYFLITLPVLTLGTFVGSYLYGLVKDESYKKMIFILLAILGSMTIYKAL